MKNLFRRNAGLLAVITVLAVIGLSIAACKAPTPDSPAVESVTVSGEAVVEKGTSAVYTATVNGSNNPGQGVTWSIDQENKKAGTSIRTTGRLTVAADESLAWIRVRATSIEDPSRSGTMTVSLSSGGSPSVVITGVTISPASASVVKGETQTFTAAVSGTGLSDEDRAVTWSIVETDKKAGTSIDSTDGSAGLLIVAADETLLTLTVKAVSNADPAKSGTVLVSITEPPPAVITGVTISPASASVVKGGSQAFTAAVSGTGLSDEDRIVTWSVVETGKNAETGISSAGVLTVAADEALSMLTVQAVSNADPSQSKTASVILVSNNEYPTDMLTLSATTSHPNSSLFLQGTGGNTVELQVAGINGYAGSAFRVDYHITDVFGSTVVADSIAYDKSSGDSQTKQIPVDTSRLGHFTFTASIDGVNTLPAHVARPAGFITYAVVLNPSQRRQKAPYGSPDVDKYLYFGMYLIPTSNFDGVVNFIEWLGVDAGISSELNWSNNVTGNATDVSKLNSLTSSSIVQTIYNLSEFSAYMPDWARSEAGKDGHYGGELSPYGEQEFVKYCEAIARIHINQAPGRPHHYYQVTWEPVDYWSGWSPLGGSYADYADWLDDAGGDEALIRVYELAYEAIHRLYDEKAAETGDASWRNKAVILGPTYSSACNGAWWNGMLWHETLLKKGLMDYMDGLSIHPYDEAENALAGGTGGMGVGKDLDIANKMRDLKSMVNTYYAGRSTPRYYDAPFFWGTEQGMLEGDKADPGWNIGKPPEGRPVRQAQLLTRYNLIMMGEGFDANYAFCFADYDGDRYGFFYNQTIIDGVNWGTWAPNTVSPKPAASAFAAASWLLKGYRSAGRLSLSGSNFGYKYEDTESSAVIYAVWSHQDQHSNITLNVGTGTVRVYDIVGNEIPSGSGWSQSGGNVTITTSGFTQYVKVGAS